MLVRELTDEDIGRVFWVPVHTGVWVRILFEGLSKKPDPENGGWPPWLVLIVSPTQPGQQLMRFRRADKDDFTGVIVASSAEIYAVEVEYAVTADGEIVEIGEKPITG